MNDTPNPQQPHDGADAAEQQRVIDALAQDARFCEEARMLPPEGRLDKEQMDLARSTLQRYIDEKQIPIAQVSKQIGRAPSTLSDWLRGRYSGDSDKLARMAMLFVEQHSRGAKPGMPAGFVTTRIAERALAVMREVQRTRTIGLIFGCAGVSKSLVCRAAESGLIVGSVHIEAMRGSHRAPQFAKLWARRLGLRWGGALGEVEDRIITALRGSNRLQLIDEAHYLSHDALDVVRDVHKQAGVGVVLLGTVDVDRAVDDATAFYGQFARLISYRYDILEEQMSGGQPLFSVDEIVQLAASMQLKLEGDAAEFLTELACVPGWGGLGAAATLLLKARVLAKDAPISMADLNDALRSSHGRTYYQRMVERRGELVRKVKVA